MNKLRTIVKVVISTSLSVALLSGCASEGRAAASSYAWSHPMSGEYLFAYDHGQCADQARGDLDAPLFFSCMQDLGYYQIDPVTGAPVASLGADAGEAAALGSSASL